MERIEYARKSQEELTDMQVAEEEHLERLDIVRTAGRAADVRMAALALAHEAFDASMGNEGHYFDF